MKFEGIMKSVQHLQNIGQYDDWETPEELFTDACAKYGIFPKLDVCATAFTAKCKEYLGPDNEIGLQNALEGFRQWNIDFFMNPPYSQIETWMRKAYYEHKKHNVNAMILTFAKVDTKWWHRYVEGIAEVHNIEGRIKFLKNGIPSKNSAPYPSCWIIWRKQ